MSSRPSSTSEPIFQVTRFEQFILGNKKMLILSSFVGMLALGIAVGRYFFSPGLTYSPHNKMMQQVRQIGTFFFAYARDHQGKYPTGKSSTEIFQQLLDQKYVSDPALFYVAMTGKTAATSNKLKPENVCFDVTDDVCSDDSESLPVVFTTGYRIDYSFKIKAYHLPNAYPDGIAVFFKGNNAAFLIAKPGGVPINLDFFRSTSPMPPFDPKGRTYSQLTPEGPLP